VLALGWTLGGAGCRRSPGPVVLPSLEGCALDAMLDGPSLTVSCRLTAPMDAAVGGTAPHGAALVAVEAGGGATRYLSLGDSPSTVSSPGTGLWVARADLPAWLGPGTWFLHATCLGLVSGVVSWERA